MVRCIYICINVYKYTNRFRDILLYTYICIYMYIHMKRVRPLGSMATLPPFTASALKRDDSKTTVYGTSAYLCSASIVFDIIDTYIYIIDHFSIYPLYHSYHINIFCLFPCYLMVLNRNSIDSSMTMNHWTTHRIQMNQLRWF